MELTIGILRVPAEKAREAIATYTAAELSGDPYAYPYYDELATNDGDELVDGDFLAPILLNALKGNALSAFRFLKQNEAELQGALGAIGREVSLQGAETDVSLIGPLYAILDGGSSEHPAHVRGTTLSKILHRKRPQFIPLYDKKIYRCYVGADAPVQTHDAEPWADFMIKVAVAIRADLTRNIDDWRSLASSVKDPDISPLRALDIVAWMLTEDPQA